MPLTDEGVDTSAFLEATEGLVKLFDLLGSSAFAIVQNDMRGNVKVRRDQARDAGCMGHRQGRRDEAGRGGQT